MIGDNKVDERITELKVLSETFRQRELSRSYIEVTDKNDEIVLSANKEGCLYLLRN